MSKIKLVLLAVILFVLSNSADAQSIRVLPLGSSNVSNTASEILYDRLNQAISLNGAVSIDNSNRFLLVPSVSIVSIKPAVMFPIRFVAEIEISLSLIDNTRKVLVSQEILTKKGVAGNEIKAVNDAVKSLKSRDTKLKKFIVNGKKEIIEYYNTECENVLETINEYIKMRKYEEALNELNAISHIDAELDCYKRAMDILSDIPLEQQLRYNENIKTVTPDISWINE